MSKCIVFCADGTWNGPGEADGDDPTQPASNVFKLFLSLAGLDAPDALPLAREQERMLTAGGGSIVQIAKYLDGVGDCENPLVKLIGGAFGAGLITRIVRGYTFVSRNYVRGDRIYLVGFSRGAYTARALAGLISAKGLLTPRAANPADREAAYRAAAAVWYQWRREALFARGDTLGRFEQVLVDLPGFLLRPPDPATLAPAPIEAVAVWDTVGALGIPDFTGQHVAVDVFQFANTTLSGNVRFGRHAVSIDEQRADFTPTLWDPDPARVVQVLFPGAHADVGGGYPIEGESGLSGVALRWMRGQLAALGLSFVAAGLAEKPDHEGTAHQPWNEMLWRALPRAPRKFPGGLGLAQSAIDRIAGPPVQPDPSQPPAAYLPEAIAPYLNGTEPAPGVVVVPV